MIIYINGTPYQRPARRGIPAWIVWAGIMAISLGIWASLGILIAAFA
jgi:hypothetical protein